jgi:hypothetical protein
MLKPEIAQRVIDGLSEGRSLRAICREEGMPSEAYIRKVAINDLEFGAQYTRARDMGLDAMADEILDIADDGTNDWMERNDAENKGYAYNGEAGARSRLRVDTRKWYLSKLAPKRYADRQIVDQTVKADVTVTPALSEVVQRVAELSGTGTIGDSETPS